MKNKVNVVKKIAFLMITVALAVALMACQGAVGKPGAKGDTGATGAPGPAGEPGPQGDPGVTDNASPTLRTGKTLPNVYLALGGTGEKLTNNTIKLNDYFTDEKTLTLGYKIVSDNETIADAKITGDTVTITGKKVGIVTFTVSVYDNVNDPVTGEFSATVVATNSAPTVTALDKVDRLELRKKLFISDGPVIRTVSPTISAGVAGTVSDKVTFSAVAGAAADSDDIVSVSAVRSGSKLNVSITPLKPGAQRVVITAKDIFGSPSSIKLKFTAIVNTPPERVLDLPNKVLHRVATAPKIDEFIYDVSDYFNLEEATTQLPTEDPDTKGADNKDLKPLASDTTCTFSTDPVQPADKAGVTTDTVAIVEPVAGGDVNISAKGLKTPAPGDVSVTKPGSFSLTITCADEEGSASGTAEITVRP